MYKRRWLTVAIMYNISITATKFASSGQHFSSELGACDLDDEVMMVILKI